MELLFGYLCLTVLFAPAIWISHVHFRHYGAGGLICTAAQILVLYAIAIVLLSDAVVAVLLFLPFATAFVLLTFLNLAFYLLYRQPLPENVIAEIFRVNPLEYREFVRGVPRRHKVVTFGYALASLVSVIWLLSSRPADTVDGIVAAIIALIVSGVSAVKGDFFSFYPQQYVRQVWRVLSQARQLKRLKTDTKRVDIDAVAPDTLSDEIYIVVIGESVRAANLSIYGYPRETTPYLSSIADELIVFEDAISPSNTTHASLKYAVTPATVDDESLFFTRKTLVNAARRAGLRSFWISNQPRDITFNYVFDVIGEEAEHKHYLNTDPTSAAPRDGDMLPLIFDAIDGRGPSLLVVHMFGSHFRYENRIDDRFRRFTRETDYSQDIRNRRQIIDNYDNTIFYLDHFLEQIISHCRDRDVASVLGFFSDHGEVLYDNGRDFGHALRQPLKKEFQVPYFYWTSAEFRRRHPQNPLFELPQRIARSAETQYVFEDIAEIIGLTFRNLDVPTSNLRPRGSGTRRGRRLVCHDRVFDFDQLEG